MKRAAFAGATYWARPAPGIGEPDAAILVVGLAPAAHGANRTGRMCTGDRSGDFLFAALHRTGPASQPTSSGRSDGMTRTGARLTAPVLCAPPANAPTPAERRACGSWLGREPEPVAPDVAVTLGAFGWQSLLATLAERVGRCPGGGRGSHTTPRCGCRGLAAASSIRSGASLSASRTPSRAG